MLDEGSSPRMRGAPTMGFGWRADGRIIPADAGSTASPTDPDQVSEDHPRGCGEHQPAGSIYSATIGSSPRMRGARRYRSRRTGGSRIIPADAGSTAQSEAGRPFRRDHPRGCGEHILLIRFGSIVLGSSPRMRGAQCGDQFVIAVLGIIPADAGSTT